MDDQTSWEKQLLVGAAVLVAVALLVGGIVAVVALKAADVAGLTSEPGNNSPTGPPAMSEDLPESASAPTTSAPATSQPPTSSPTTTSPPSKDDRKKDRKKKRRNRIELQVSPPSAGTYERVNLTGSYRAGDGATLQVQRLESGSWVDFPTSATVSGGTFSTYIETGHTGPNKFRMLDTATGRTSNVAVVRIS
jgi:hypothetical protein